VECNHLKILLHFLTETPSSPTDREPAFGVGIIKADQDQEEDLDTPGSIQWAAGFPTAFYFTIATCQSLRCQIHTTDRKAAFGEDGSGKVNSNTRWNAVSGVLVAVESFVASILMVQTVHVLSLQ
jgi:hypothetical protein